MKKIALISYGCAKNLVDSEVMLGCLNRSGYSLKGNPDEAEIIIINTCGFIKPAKKESYNALRKFTEIKDKSKAKTIIAAGCFVERDKEILKNEFPQVDIWMGVNDFDKIVQIIEGNSYKRSEKSFLYDHNSPRLISTPPSWSYIKISEGCSHQCSFCAIPLIKGPYRSRPIMSILKEAHHLSSKGVKEINLVSQDTTYFGRDLGKKDGFINLLKGLLKVKGLEWIRILYGYPEEISDSLLELMKEKKICSYLDIPFQHSDTEIVRKMKRGMNRKRALELIERIRTNGSRCAHA